MHEFGPAVVSPEQLIAFLYAREYADISTLAVVVPFPLDTAAAVESLNHDLNRVSDWCVLWGVRLNGIKTKTMIHSMQVTRNVYLVVSIHSGWNLSGEFCRP